MTASLAGITLYPIKSCGGISVTSWRLDRLGLEYDRRWMLVDQAGRAVTQREWPVLSRTEVALTDGAIRVSAPGRRPVAVPLGVTEGESVPLSLWGWRGTGLGGRREVDAWFTELLGAPVRLVYCPPAGGQEVNPEYAPAPTRAAFTDGFPLLVISQASLEELNRRLPAPATMRRFRPNLTLTGTEPFAEDQMGRFRLGLITMAAVKGCDRCVMTTIDPDTGEKGPEPLRTLATFRKWDGKVWFGQNVIHHDTGTLTVGDQASSAEA
jgi:uncharacterized protein YcbX